MRSLCLLAFLLVATGVSTRAAAPSSSSADLKVTVQDQTGAALVIAVVTFVDSAGALHTLTVDARGVAAFAALPEGPGELRVAADAFKSYSGPIVLKKGANAFSLQLPLANITAEIVVRQEEADRQGNSFVSTLDERQIAELPDDPDEMEQMLQQMAGPGAVMRINGFRGGQMPPKNQIRQIRFRMNSYAAENHDAGGFGIDIFTKPGTDAWRGMSSFGFRDESLNARNAFAPRLGPEQYPARRDQLQRSARQEQDVAGGVDGRQLLVRLQDDQRRNARPEHLGPGPPPIRHLERCRPRRARADGEAVLDGRSATP